MLRCLDSVGQSKKNLQLSRGAQLPVEEKPVPLHKKEQRTPEYLAINPLGKVPALQVGRL